MSRSNRQPVAAGRGGFALRLVAVLLVLILLGLGVALYLQAGRAPETYEPPELSEPQRRRASRRFYRQLMELNNRAQDVRPFTWTLREKQINEYLASLDEIAADAPGAEPGAVHRALRSVGLDRPAVDLHPGGLTLFVRADQLGGKVVSADLGFALTDAGKLRVSLDKARVGRLPVPLSEVRGRLRRLQAELDRRIDSGETPRQIGPANVKQVARALAMVIGAVDAEPIDTTAEWDGKLIRLVGMDADNQAVTLSFEPIRRAARR
ncbi:MAG: hypothetical protein ACOC93_04870 [Planctomycetota bacterium]